MKKKSIFFLLLLIPIMSYCDESTEQVWTTVDAHQFCHAIPKESHLTLELPLDFECTQNLGMSDKKEEQSYLWGPKKTLNESIQNLERGEPLSQATCLLNIFFPKEIIQTGGSSFNIEKTYAENSSYRFIKLMTENHPILFVEYSLGDGTAQYFLYIGLNHETNVLGIKLIPQKGNPDKSKSFGERFLTGIDRPTAIIAGSKSEINLEELPPSCVVIQHPKTQIKNWQVVNRSLLELEAITWLVPNNQSTISWTEAIMLTDEKLPAYQKVTQSYMNAIFNAMRKMTAAQFPDRETTWEILDRDENSLVFLAKIYNPKDNFQLESHIGRFFFENYSLHRAIFIKRGEGLHPSELQNWLQILKTSTSIQTLKDASNMPDSISFGNERTVVID